MLTFSDLSCMSEQEVREHIIDDYAATRSDADRETIQKELERYEILIAYENCGNWGCDSTSWFLLREKSTGELFENSGGHCSCHGFEGQWEPFSTSVVYLKSEHFYISFGGYEENGESIKSMIDKFILTLGE